MKKKKNSLRIFYTLIFLFAFTAFGICLFMAHYIDTQKTKHNIMKTYDACEINSPCKLTFTVNYNKEPVDIELISPSGKKYTKYTADTYHISNSAVVLTVTTEDIGQWKCSYNTKRNTKLSADIKSDYVEKLFLTNVIYSDNHVTLNSQYGNGSSNKTYKISAYMNSVTTKQSCIVYEGQHELNKSIEFDLNTENMQTADDWELTIIAYIDNTSINNTYTWKYSEPISHTYVEPATKKSEFDI